MRVGAASSVVLFTGSGERILEHCDLQVGWVCTMLICPESQREF